MLIDHHHLPAPVESENRRTILGGNGADIRRFAGTMAPLRRHDLHNAARDINEYVAIREENPPTPSYRLTFAGVEVDAIHDYFDAYPIVLIERCDGFTGYVGRNKVTIEVLP